MPYYQTPGLRVQLTYDDGTKTDTFLHPDALLQKDKYTVFTGGNQPSLQVSSNAAGTERVLVLKDSYANCFIPFLLGDYAQIDVVDLRYLRDTTVDSLIEREGYDDLLILYNFQSFSSDTNLVLLGSGAKN